MPDPAWFTGLIDWWSMESLDYSGTGSLPDHAGGGHPGTTVISTPVIGVNDTTIVTLESTDAPPWFCSKGAGVKVRIWPAIITNHDLAGSNPFQIKAAYGGSPWYSPSSWTLAIWARADEFGAIAGGPPPLDSYLISDLAISHYEVMTLIGDEVSDGASENGWRIQIGTDGKSVNFTSHSTADITIGTLTDDQWHLYVVTSDGTTIKTYMDTTPGGTLAHSGFAVSSNSILWGTRNAEGPGDFGYAQPWNGSFADTLMWDRALSADDIVEFFLGLDCAQVYRIKSKIHGVRPTWPL